MPIKSQMNEHINIQKVELAYARAYPTVYKTKLGEKETMNIGMSIERRFVGNSKEIIDKIKELLESVIKKEIKISNKETPESVEYVESEKYIKFPIYLLEINNSTIELRLRINPCLDSSTSTKIVIIAYCVEEDVQKFRSIGEKITKSIADVIAEYYHKYLGEYNKGKGQPLDIKTDIQYEFSITSIGSEEDYMKKLIDNVENNDFLQKLSLENKKAMSIISDIKNITHDSKKYKWIFQTTSDEKEKGVYGFKPITKKEGEIVGLVYGDIHNSDRSLLIEILNKI